MEVLSAFPLEGTRRRGAFEGEGADYGPSTLTPEETKMSELIIDRGARVLFLKNSLGLTEKQAVGLVELGGFASRRALECLFVDTDGFDVEILEIEHFEARGCTDEARCVKGHTLKHKYWLRIGGRKGHPQDYGVGVTCLGHLQGVTTAERRAIATIGSWVIDQGYNALTRMFGRARDREEKRAQEANVRPDPNSGMMVYKRWKESQAFADLVVALAAVSLNPERAATQAISGRGRYGLARLKASIALLQKCEECELPAPPLHERRILAGYRRLLKASKARHLARNSGPVEAATAKPDRDSVGAVPLPVVPAARNASTLPEAAPLAAAPVAGEAGGDPPFVVPAREDSGIQAVVFN